MILRFFSLLFCLIVFTPNLAWAETWTHTSPQWQALGRGLGFTEVQVSLNGRQVETLAVVKVDPAANAFRVFHHAPQSIAAWQAETKAVVVFNASYYCTDGKPCGLILADGQPLGPWRNRQMRGMFVAEPKGRSPDLPRATILDLVSSRVDVYSLPWSQGVQSFPLLLDYKGRIRVKESDKKARRSVIAADRHGNILVFNSAGEFFTLYDLARFLKASAFEIDSALNLDGGTEAQLHIKAKDFEFSAPSTWASSLGEILDSQQFRLPTVIGVFPRQ